jgi:uncharacterized SAM-binding protein YcdF (DUF218 family)
MKHPPNRLRNAVIILALLACAIILVLRYGGDLLVGTDRLPAHAQVAVALNGSITAYVARRAEAMRLLKSGLVDHAMMSLPPGSYWGENIPQVAQHYFATRYGPAIAQKVAYCVNSANSTIQEAAALKQCLQQAGWRQVIVVTSIYHTRRGRMIWRKTLAGSTPPFQLWMHGVVDADFRPQGWWRRRRYAKTWLFETSKLLWEFAFGAGPWKGTRVKGQLVTAEPAGPSSSVGTNQ